MPQKFGNRGFGAAYGSEHLAGGLIYVVSTPDENKSIYPSSNGGYLDILVGVQGSLIDLTSVKIYINAFIVFDGGIATPGFTPRYSALSSYEYSQADNGYLFHIKESPRFGLLNQDITVQASAVNGEQAEMTYRIFLYPQFQGVYPPVPKGRPLGHVPMGRFSGQSEDGLLDGQGPSGQVYFSPSLQVVSAGADVDFNKVEVLTDAQDRYELKAGHNARPVMLGPWKAVPENRAFPPHFTVGHVPRLNHSQFRLLRTKNADVTGTLTQTIGPPSETKILY